MVMVMVIVMVVAVVTGMFWTEEEHHDGWQLKPKIRRDEVQVSLDHAHHYAPPAITHR